MLEVLFAGGVAWESNLAQRERGSDVDFCHDVLCQLGKYASGPGAGEPSRASVNTYG